VLAFVQHPSSLEPNARNDDQGRVDASAGMFFMKAMILAAGLGTRLHPLTLARPKVLVPVMGITVLEFWMNRFYREGFEGVVINAHHLSERLVDAVTGTKWPIPVDVRVEPTILGTGGGIRNVLDFFAGRPFVVVNGDIICNVSLRSLFDRHIASGGSVSLLMHDCPPFNNVAVDSNGQVLGFGRETGDLLREHPGEVRLSAFTGIHVINPEVLEDLSASQPCDILTPYRRLIQEGHPPRSESEPGFYWREMGSLSSYRQLHAELGVAEDSFLQPIPTGSRVRVHERARVEPGVRIIGTIVVGEGSLVMEGAELEDTILWEGVRVEKGARLRNCIVADKVTVAGFHEDEIIAGDGL
jgi:mannose-1-phosphate guanylyltransferase